MGENIRKESLAYPLCFIEEGLNLNIYADIQICYMLNIEGVAYIC